MTSEPLGRRTPPVNTEGPLPSNDPSRILYNLCRELKEGVHINVRKRCEEAALRRYLLHLIDPFEWRHGRQHDGWIVSCSFTDTSWDVNPEFEVKPEHLLSLLTEVIGDAFWEPFISLALPHFDTWISSVLLTRHRCL